MLIDNLSIALIVKDEEKNIKRCLDSLPQAEIIVVDTGSVDGTKDILKQYPVKVYDYKWNDSFADARNFAISKCTKDWILMIDADEELKTFELPDNKYDYGIVKVTNLIQGKQMSFSAIRLFRNQAIIRYEGMRQATVDKSVKDLPGYHAKLEILHYGYDMTRAEQREKVLKNLDEYLKQYLREPDNLTVRKYLCHSYRYLGEWQTAIDFGLLALEYDLNKEMKAEICIDLYLCYNQLGKLHIAIEWLHNSLKYLPRQVLGRLLLAQVYCQQGLGHLLVEQIKIIKDICENKSSELPNDYHYTEEELNKYLLTIKN